MVHVHFLRHPVVCTPVKILLPSPFVFKWHKLVQVSATVNHGFVVNLNALRAISNSSRPGATSKCSKAADARAIESVGFVDRTEWVPADCGAATLCDDGCAADTFCESDVFPVGWAQTCVQVQPVLRIIFKIVPTKDRHFCSLFVVYIYI